MERDHTEAMLDGIQRSLQGSPFVLPTYSYEQLTAAAEATIHELNTHAAEPDSEWDERLDAALAKLGQYVIDCLVLDVADSHLR